MARVLLAVKDLQSKDAPSLFFIFFFVNSNYTLYDTEGRKKRMKSLIVFPLLLCYPGNSHLFIIFSLA